jgi:hypothetical protein
MISITCLLTELLFYQPAFLIMRGLRTKSGGKSSGLRRVILIRVRYFAGRILEGIYALSGPMASLVEAEKTEADQVAVEASSNYYMRWIPCNPRYQRQQGTDSIGTTPAEFLPGLKEAVQQGRGYRM